MLWLLIPNASNKKCNRGLTLQFSRETERFCNSIAFYVNDSTSEQTVDQRTDGKSLFVADAVRFRKIAFAFIQLGANGND